MPCLVLGAWCSRCLAPFALGTRHLERHRGTSHLAHGTRLRHQDPVEQALQFLSAFGELAVAPVDGIAAAEQFVGNIQRGQDGEAEGVAAPNGFGRGAHFIVHKRGEQQHVLRLERCPDRVLLSLNADRDDVGVCHRLQSPVASRHSPVGSPRSAVA